MAEFTFESQSIPDVFVITPQIFGDHRGYFMETWNYNEFEKNGLNQQFVQDNQSKSSMGVLRGLHFQKKHPQGKLVRVLSGEVYDVAVDIRQNSPYYGKWVSVVLSGENKRQLYIPEGFAHGFLVLSEFAEFAYKCTQFYDPTDESGILWNDPDLSISWPAIPEVDYILSEKDQKNKLFSEIWKDVI